MGVNETKTLEPPTVLIVEDSKIEAAILRHLLDRGGYTTRVPLRRGGAQ